MGERRKEHVTPMRGKKKRIWHRGYKREPVCLRDRIINKFWGGPPLLVHGERGRMHFPQKGKKSFPTALPAFSTCPAKGSNFPTMETRKRPLEPGCYREGKALPPFAWKKGGTAIAYTRRKPRFLEKKKRRV